MRGVFRGHFAFVRNDGDVYSGLLHFGVGHLRSHCASPYEVVELLLLCVSVDGAVADICGADCLVCLLGAFGMGVVMAYFQILLSIAVADRV